MKKFISKPAALIKYMLLAVLAVSFIAACGYDDVNEEKAKAAAEYYADDATPRSALIEAETLKSYIDAGYVTPDGKKVLILYVTAQNSSPTVAESIKGAYAFDQEDYFMEARSDGPVVNASMVASGAKVDAFLREFGIDMNTLVVLTSYGHENQMLSRAFWTLKYWGFSNKHVKVLHGTDKYFFGAFATENGGQTFIDQYKAPFRTDKPTPSTFSVKNLPGQKMDLYRAPIGEVLGYAKSGALNPDATGNAVIVSTLDAKIPVVRNGYTVTYTIYNTNAIDGRINGATQLAMTEKEDGTYNNNWNQYIAPDGRYKENKDIEALIGGLTTDGTTRGEFLKNIDKNKRVLLHCFTGRTTSPHWFVFRELLGYSNAAVYDGSYQEWISLTIYKPLQKNDVFVNYKNSDTSIAGSTPSSAQSDYLEYKDGAFMLNNGVNADNKVIPNTIFTNSNWDTTKYTKFLTMSYEDKAKMSNSEIGYDYVEKLTFSYDNEYAGDGREINTADKNYQAGKDSSSTGGNSGGASSGGGSAPAGC